MKRITFLNCILALTVLSLGTIGCESTTSGTPPTKSTAPAAFKSDVATSEIDSDLYTLTKSVKTSQSIGQTYTYEYVVKAKEDLTDVVIADTLPSGLEYVSSTPTAQVSDNKIVWNLGDINEGDISPLTLTVKATRTGTFANCVTITAIPKACLAVVVGAPELMIEKTTPKERLLSGETATFDITVTNTGNADAENVVLTDILPEGLTASSSLRYNLGDLAPSESKTVEVLALTSKSGKFLNTASAVGSNVAKVADDAVVYVNTPGLKVEKTGTGEQFVGKKASYEIVVTNTGDFTLTDVVVTDTLGEGMAFASTPGAKVVEPRKAMWNISSLKPQASKTFKVTTTAELAGRYCNNVAAVDADLKLEDSSTACTVWKGFPAILLEVIDTVDPLLEGQPSQYVIRVTNQGNAPDYNIQVGAEIAPELSITSVAGQTQHQVNGNKVTFASFAKIDPKQTIEFKIDVRGKTIGGGRSNFSLSSNLLKEPISETESTQVY
ncbi:MAG: DUF11 domain-containing protein [Verrucomicrobiota bacterium]